MTIPVEDRSDGQAPQGPEPDSRGRRVAGAFIGSEALFFEMFVPDAKTNAAPEVGRARGATYWIQGIRVHPDVYRDALQTADKDRWCPGCGTVHGSSHDEDVEAAPKAGEPS